MISVFVVGMCLYMNGAFYRVDQSDRTTYLLAQTVVVHEQRRTYRQYWKKSWVDSHAKISRSTCGDK